VDKATTSTKPRAKPDKERLAFFAEQRVLLLDERATYVRSAEALKAQADSLALEHEPGDVQFDEEGGEGGTANVDREIDLHLSAQARATVVEIDRALEKLDDGTYGLCEHCGSAIPDARLQALPYAALCVACKSGGLSSRR
jgi:DnaK suppressor protein